MTKVITVTCLCVCFFTIVIGEHFTLKKVGSLRFSFEDLVADESYPRPTIAGRPMRTNLRSSGPSSRVRNGVSRAYNPLTQATTRYNSRARSPASDKNRPSSDSARPSYTSDSATSSPPTMSLPVSERETMSLYEQITQQEQQPNQSPAYEAYDGSLPGQTGSRSPSSPSYGYEQQSSANEGDAYGPASGSNDDQPIPIRSGRYGQPGSVSVSSQSQSASSYNRPQQPRAQPQTQLSPQTIAALYAQSQQTSNQNQSPYGSGQSTSNLNPYGPTIGSGQPLSNPYGKDEVTEVKKLIIQDVDNDSYVSLQQLCDTENEREIEREWQKYVVSID